jgi:hypothetical protein
MVSSGHVEAAWNRVCEIVMSKANIDLRRAV